MQISRAILREKTNMDICSLEIQNVIKSIKDNKIIIVSKMQEEANSLNILLEQNGMYWATTYNTIEGLSYVDNCRIYILKYDDDDNEYIRNIMNKVYEASKTFKIISLLELKDFHDNKDILKWINAENTSEKLIKAFNRSLDLKNKNLLQQDDLGIYKYVNNKKEDDIKKVYITNFNVIKATRIIFVDKQVEGINLILKSDSGEKFKRIGEVSVFDDMKIFKNFLASMDITFKGKLDDLTNLKMWINRYFTFNVEEIHSGVKFITKNDTRMLITNNGAILGKSVDSTIISVEGIAINIKDTEPINNEETKELMKHIFNFASKEKTICILGSLINNLCIEQSETLKIKGHHLLIAGESGSGKSTILKNVIAAILNYPDEEIKSIGLITNFALIKAISTGNYPVIFDEYKPSLLDKYKNAKLSEIFRNSYDRTTVSRGDKTLNNRNFVLNRPIILAGEESYKNAEKALMERSCIVYLSKAERTIDNENSMEWLQKNEEILNKLGISLIKIILNLDVLSYQELRDTLKPSFTDLRDRVLNTAINIATGIEIFNILLKELGLDEILNYADLITQNIKSEILNDSQDSLSSVQQMLVLYNQLIEDGRAQNVKEVVVSKSGKIYIKTSEMINQILEFNKNVGADIIILNLKDFKKQAKKSNYIVDTKYLHAYTGSERKTIRFDVYNKKKLQELNLNSIAPADMLEVADENSDIPF
ncbi:ATP-binding protein [Clostridium algidicarnis]|uniref:ATP-binding protein n=1 Tax=Clostridium algidicarnis TaxID=37659 RepID=UPI00068A5BFD|nr:ATP-binding protein [Clostridium algidicarnis]